MKQILTSLTKKANEILMITVLAGAMTSCDSILGFDDGDCSIEYRVKFKYDYNMDGVDRFATDVRSVNLYAFDDQGKFVYWKTESGEMLADGTYSMKLDTEDEQHHLVVWAGLDDQSFAVPLLTTGQSIDDLKVKMLRNKNQTRAAGEEGLYIVEDALSPLWHGEIQKKSETRSSDRKNIQTVSLTKNTNTVHISVAQVDQNNRRSAATRAISKNSLSYALYDQNGYMNYDNTLLTDNLLTYLPYEVKEEEVATRAFTPAVDTEYPAVTADLSVGRLLNDNTPRLNIKNALTGETLVANGNLMGYIQQTWEEHYKERMSFQEYLDREDEFYIVLFVNETMALINTVIQVNGWIININDIEL